MTATATKTRVRRTPAQRAQAELDAAWARVTKTAKALDNAQDALDNALDEHERAKVLAAHAAQHPDLLQPSADDLPKASETFDNVDTLGRHDGR